MTKEEKIKQRRAQMLIHCYLYYVLDTAIISDHLWQQWADELTSLQKDNKTHLYFYDDVFKDWDGSTGYHLPKDPWVVRKANQILKYYSMEGSNAC